MSESLRLPPSWSRMGFCAKAAYLCSSHQARDYSEACSMLARMRRPKVKLPPQKQAPLWWQKD